MKRLEAVTLLAVMTLLILAAPKAYSAPQARVYVKVVGPGGSPIENATVLIFNLRILKPVFVGYTNSSGMLTATIPSREYYVMYVFKASGDRLLSLPVRVDLMEYLGLTRLEARVTLYPAARIVVTGRILYIGGMPAGAARIMILSREGSPISQSLKGGDAVVTIGGKREEIRAEIVDVYGPTRDFTFIKLGMGRTLLKMREGLAPLNVPLRVRVNYTVLDLRTFTLREISVDFGSFESPLVFTSSDQVFEIDLLKTSLAGQIIEVKKDLERARSMVDAFERMGFYIPDVRDLLKAGDESVSEAERLFAKGAAASKVVALLERGYAIANDWVPKRLGFLRDIAKTGAIIMPSFLAVFAAVLAFYFFESSKMKMVAFSGIYAVLVLAFAYLYPGFQLLWSLDRTLFVATVGGAYAIFFALVFVLPRVLKEPELPGEIALGGLIAIAFTLGKRYSKLRVLRTSITVFSIAAFIWAFTVLASFGTVYTKIEEPGFASYAFDTVIVKRVTDSTFLPLNLELDPLLFENRSEVVGASLILFNRHDVKLRVIASHGGREEVMHFAMGINSSELKRNPFLSQAVKLVTAFEEDSILLPYSKWASLGLRGGEEIEVIFEAEGYPTAKLKLRAAGYFDEALLDKWLDPDGMPVRPFILKEGRALYANSTDLVIAPPSLLLHILKPPEGGEYSGVFYLYEVVARPTSYEAGRAFVNEVIERRGENYVAISCYGGKCTRVYFGTRIESVFQRDITFAVPLVIVVFNVLLTMVSIVRERRREIFIFMTVGFNPRHIALVFLAEAIIYGLLSGGFGYVAGLATFRALSTFAKGQNLLVREKLEWYWSYVAIALAVVVAILGAIKPSMDAAYMFAPTEVKKIKVEEKRELIKREERYLRTAAMKTFSIPGEIEASEGEIAFSYIYSKLSDLSYGELERVEELEEHPMEERPDGTRIKRFTFKYVSTTEEGGKASIECELRFVLSPGSDNYRIELDTKPVGQAPISHMDYAADLVKRIVGDWMRERERLL
ncbi:MAG: hypothetical protein DRK00_03080 [Thermoprotei archaeon]|nr:MAG: hypothetical protein DRK00_03080 [Thermoprotei archaeon]